MGPKVGSSAGRSQREIGPEAKSGSTLTTVWIVPLLALFGYPDTASFPKAPEPVVADTTDSLRAPRDTAASHRAPSSHPPLPPAPPYHAPPWSWEIAPRAGALAVDFPQKANFVSDIGALVAANGMVQSQPFPGSDLAWSLGFDLTARRLDIFRLVAGLGWSAWSAQAIASQGDSLLQALTGRDSVIHRSYSSDIWTAEIGFDVLIPRRILSVDAARDAFLGFRYRTGVGRLEGRTTAWGWSSGESFLIGADVYSWKKWALSGILGWNALATSSDRSWTQMLWNTSNPASSNWNGGGLSLEFQLRWGSDRDSQSVAGAQKK